MNKASRGSCAHCRPRYLHAFLPLVSHFQAFIALPLQSAVSRPCDTDLPCAELGLPQYGRRRLQLKLLRRSSKALPALCCYRPGLNCPGGSGRVFSRCSPALFPSLRLLGVCVCVYVCNNSNKGTRRWKERQGKAFTANKREILLYIFLDPLLSLLQLVSTRNKCLRILPKGSLKLFPPLRRRRWLWTRAGWQHRRNKQPHNENQNEESHRGQAARALVTRCSMFVCSILLAWAELS